MIIPAVSFYYAALILKTIIKLIYMQTNIEIEERSNGMKLIKIVFETGNTFNLRVYPSGELEVNGGFSGALIIKPIVTNEIIIKHEN